MGREGFICCFFKYPSIQHISLGLDRCEGADLVLRNRRISELDDDDDDGLEGRAWKRLYSVGVHIRFANFWGVRRAMRAWRRVKERISIPTPRSIVGIAIKQDNDDLGIDRNCGR
jgi:hypothetical protein